MVKLKIKDCDIINNMSDSVSKHKKSMEIDPSDVKYIREGNQCMYVVLKSGEYIRTEYYIDFIDK